MESIMYGSWHHREKSGYASLSRIARISLRKLEVSQYHLFLLRRDGLLDDEGRIRADS